MRTVRYEALPNPRFLQDADREMEDAFDLTDEQQDTGDNESIPLARHVEIPQAESSSSSGQRASITQGTAYDFEREYDFPPPGSPPPPTAQARPNDFGNSNGLLPTSPVDRPQPKQSFFRRIVGAVLPSQYQPLSTGSHLTRRTGGGNDGVFANVVAKPQPARTAQNEDGEVIVLPEETQKDSPPSYQEAQADAVPPYWETTIHTYSDVGLYLENLPTGSFFMFCATTFVSFFFQFIGFLVTYLLHTTHAAKYGSRAGLGLTLIQYGLTSRSSNSLNTPDGSGGQGSQGSWAPSVVVPGDSQNGTVPDPSPSEPIEMAVIPSKDWLPFLFMTLGWFILLTSVLGFWRVKRYERTVQQSSNTNPQTPADTERDPELTHIFGIPPGAEQHREHNSTPPHTSDTRRQAVQREDDALYRDLRYAGLV